MNDNKPSNNAYKILVIDDDYGTTQLISMMLERGGYEPVVANSGEDGIAYAHQELPDLIMCDVMMPDIDGFSVLQALQSSSDTATIPFIFLTARTRQEDMRAGMGLGADDYLTKPILSEALLSAISTRIKRHQVLQAGRLAAFAQRLVLSQEHYRKQMAYALDNDISQSLRSLQFILNLLDAPADAALYNEANAQLGGLIQRVEGLAQELHPTILGRLGLIPAVRWLAEQYELEIELELENLEYAFDPQVEICLFRLIQESLNNVVQHAQTNQVKIILKYAPPYVELRVVDNGVGFDLEQTLRLQLSAGLPYMYGLVDWLRGELNIASSPGEGTVVYALLPQTAAEPAARQSVSKRFLQLAGRRQPSNGFAAATTAGAVKILLAMEQPLQLQGLKKLLGGNMQFQIVGEARNLAETLAAMEMQKPHLLIIDPVTEGKNQTEILHAITAAHPDTAVLVISPATHGEYVQAALASGALGYIPNTATITDMHTAIMRVAQKQYYVSPAVKFDLAGWQKTEL
jgi:two-component system, OmpR family, alkaline phosphatase synthesis response regulator PhoP